MRHFLKLHCCLKFLSSDHCLPLVPQGYSYSPLQVYNENGREQMGLEEENGSWILCYCLFVNY